MHHHERMTQLVREQKHKGRVVHEEADGVLSAEGVNLDEIIQSFPFV